MAGTEHSGWAAADPDLFRGAPWLVLVADGADVRRVGDVCRLALSLGAHPVPIHPDSHDRALATVSHLPHVLAAALTLQAEQHLPLAAARSTAPLASPPATRRFRRPWSSSTVRRSTAPSSTSTHARAVPGDDDPSRWFVSARAVWDRFGGRDLVAVERPLTPTALRAVGEIGGHLTGVGDTTFTAVVPG